MKRKIVLTLSLALIILSMFTGCGILKFFESAERPNLTHEQDGGDSSVSDGTTTPDSSGGNDGLNGAGSDGKDTNGAGSDDKDTNGIGSDDKGTNGADTNGAGSDGSNQDGILPDDSKAQTENPNEGKHPNEGKNPNEGIIYGEKAVYRVNGSDMEKLYEIPEEDKDYYIGYAGIAGDLLIMNATCITQDNYDSVLVSVSLKTGEADRIEIPEKYVDGFFINAIYDDIVRFSYYDFENVGNVYCYGAYSPIDESFYEDDFFNSMEMEYQKEGYKHVVYKHTISYDFANGEETFLFNSDENKLSIVGLDSERVIEPEIKPNSFAFVGKGHIFGMVEESDENYKLIESKIYSYDVDTGEATFFHDNIAGGRAEIIDIVDGYVYYYLSSYNGYGLGNTYSIYRKKIESDEAYPTKLTDVSVVPYSSILTFDDLHLAIFEDKLYYLATSEKDTRWYRMDLNDPKFETDETECIDSVNEYYEIGEINVVSQESKRTTKEGESYEYFATYREDFRFKEGLNNYERINEILKKHDEEFEQNAKGLLENREELMEMEEFEPDMYLEYNYDKKFMGAQKLGSHFAQVAYSDYEYTGGAHGHGGRYYYLFDTDTGEELTLKQVIGIKEKAFKDIVAKYSADMWELDQTEGEGRFYSAEVDETGNQYKSMYKNFYENAKLDMLVRYSEDYLYVVYMPYEYGPYSSGYIEVEIPYEELGIELN